MSAQGGSMKGISIGGREFKVTADSDSGRDFGGYTRNAAPNGDLTARALMTAKVWKSGAITIEIDNSIGDQEYLDSIAASPDDYDCILSYVDNTDYGGQGNIEGDIVYSSSNASASIELTGPGKLTKL